VSEFFALFVIFLFDSTSISDNFEGSIIDRAAQIRAKLAAPLILNKIKYDFSGNSSHQQAGDFAVKEEVAVFKKPGKKGKKIRRRIVRSVQTASVDSILKIYFRFMKSSILSLDQAWIMEVVILLRPQSKLALKRTTLRCY
jgi:hypothetical protein